MKLNSYITWKLKLNKTNTLNYFFIKCIILDTKKKKLDSVTCLQETHDLKKKEKLTIDSQTSATSQVLC